MQLEEGLSVQHFQEAGSEKRFFGQGDYLQENLMSTITLHQGNPSAEVNLR